MQEKRDALLRSYGPPTLVDEIDSGIGCV
jgi:hypothetical protein